MATTSPDDPGAAYRDGRRGLLWLAVRVVAFTVAAVLASGWIVYVLAVLAVLQGIALVVTATMLVRARRARREFEAALAEELRKPEDERAPWAREQDRDA